MRISAVGDVIVVLGIGVHGLLIEERAVIHVVLKLRTVNDDILNGAAADHTEESPCLGGIILCVKIKRTTAPYLMKVLDDMTLSVKRAAECMVIIIVINHGQSADWQEVVIMVEAVALRIKSVRRAGVTVSCTCHVSHFHIDVTTKLKESSIEFLYIILNKDTIDDAVRECVCRA